MQFRAAVPTSADSNISMTPTLLNYNGSETLPLHVHGSINCSPVSAGPTGHQLFLSQDGNVKVKENQPMAAAAFLTTKSSPNGADVRVGVVFKLQSAKIGAHLPQKCAKPVLGNKE